MQLIISQLKKWPSYHPAKNVTTLLACKVAPLNERAVPMEFDKLVITETLSVHQHSTVYGAHLTDKDNMVWKENGKPVGVAVKMGSLDTIAEEAMVYRAMQPIQGRVIPRMFSFLKALGGTGDDLGCLLLERFGEAVQIPLYYLEKSEKAIILSHLQEMHDLGFVHDNLDGPNVLHRDKEFRIIDLDLANMTVNHHHDCNVYPSLLDFDTSPSYFQPYMNEQLCDPLLLQAADTLHFWDHDIARVRSFEFKKGPDMPTDRLMRALFPMFLVYHYSRGTLLKEMLVDYFQRIQKLVSQGYTFEKLEAEALDVMEQVRADAKERNVEPECHGKPEFCSREIGYLYVPRHLLP